MFEKVTYELTQSVCNNDGESLTNLFADNGVYHDYIYGSFKGKKNIKLMLNNYFHRDAKNFFWEMSEHVLTLGLWAGPMGPWSQDHRSKKPSPRKKFDLLFF